MSNIFFDKELEALKKITEDTKNFVVGSDFEASVNGMKQYLKLGNGDDDEGVPLSIFEEAPAPPRVIYDDPGVDIDSLFAETRKTEYHKTIENLARLYNAELAVLDAAHKERENKFIEKMKTNSKFNPDRFASIKASGYYEAVCDDVVAELAGEK